MHIKNTVFLPLLLLSSFLLSSCEEPEQEVVIDSRPVKTVLISGGKNIDVRTFPAIVDAIQKADISFRVSGKIQKILVKEGDSVVKGQVLAQLDQTDFKITLNDRQANFDTAKANYERAKKLVDKGAISKADHDNIRARFFTARAQLNEAKQNLIYTELKANFDGIIAKRYVENFEEVILSKTIFSLEDVSSLKLIVDVPENLMIAIDKRNKNERDIYATFDAIDGKKFPLKISEVSTKADPTTKTFRVTMVMDAPEGYNILPGMTATVSSRMLENESNTALSTALPVSAIVADANKQSIVWVVDEKTMTVSPKPVTTGLMRGDTILVDGLKGGERIVTAGAAFLRENMKVTLLQTSEQAE